MGLDRLELAIKPALDGRQMIGSRAVSREQLSAFATDMRRAADTGTSAFFTTRTVLKSIST
jgi:hypothetical protein